MKQIKTRVCTLIIIALLFVIGYLANKVNTKNIAELPIKSEDTPNQLVDDKQAWLNIPYKYFSAEDLQWAGTNQVAYKNIAVYQSYPSLETKIKNYDNLSDNLVNRTMTDIENGFKSKQIEIDNNLNILEGDKINLFDEWRNSTIVQSSLNRYGKLNMHYFPEKYIQLMDTYDVDDDGNKETVFTLNYTDSADGGSTSTDIIKNGKIIFSINESQSKIVQAETNNGFYVEWGIPDDQSPHCCEAGFMRTRFVYEDHIFKPLYEQEVRYIKVGTEDDQPVNINK